MNYIFKYNLVKRPSSVH